MYGTIHCRMVDGGWVELSIRAASGDDFTDILDQIKFRLHVLVYDKKYGKYKTSIYELERLSQMCEKFSLTLFVTDAVLRADKRLVYLRKHHKKLRKRKKVELDLELWTDDKDFQLFDYQKWSAVLLTHLRRGMLGDDMGVGKTIQAIAIILNSWEQYDYSDALIVVPTRLKKQWKEEILLFTKLKPNQIEIMGERFCRTKERPFFMAKAHACRECKFYDACKHDADLQRSSVGKYRELQIKRSRVLITSYESVRTHASAFIKDPYNVVIFDEATKLKNHKSGISKACAKFVHSLQFGAVVIPMSGTFIENRLEELYSPMDIVDSRVLGGFPNFEVQYLVKDWQGNVTGYRNEKKLKKKLDYMLIRRTVDEVWKDRPPLIESIIECPLTPEQTKFYAEAREGVLQDIEDLQKAESVNMANVAPLIGYLLQIACTVKAIDPETKIKRHSSKLEILCEMIREEFPRKCKIVIFSHYANNVIPYILEELEALKMGYVEKIVGGISEKKQDRIVKRFRENDDFRFLLCSDAMAYGANLQCANYVINFDLPWNPAKLDQRIRRVYRRGQKKTVTVINFTVPGTIVEHRYQTLLHKRKLFAMFLKESVVSKGGRQKVDIKAMIAAI